MKRNERQLRKYCDRADLRLHPITKKENALLCRVHGSLMCVHKELVMPLQCKPDETVAAWRRRKAIQKALAIYERDFVRIILAQLKRKFPTTW